MNFSDLPGALAFDSKTKLAFCAAKKEKGDNYRARTKHLINNSPLFTNRLFLESSPYLLQHAHNPVSWYPWSDEAFETARSLNRPILLSIGYSTCHWCHVMEEESFEDIEIASFLNKNYISIKVDREERPDVDAVYMSALQALRGAGGWPMNVWLTPDRRPFFAGTYFPSRDGERGIQTGFLKILQTLHQAFLKDPQNIEASAKQLTQAVQERMTLKETGTVDIDATLKTASEYYLTNFDTENGGLLGSPKFPSSLPIRFLLREYQREDDQRLLHMATLSLKKMANGGIYDHIAGGFHRYSTDEKWLVPHFEKMLYDNALLAIDYLESFQLTRDPYFERITREVLSYLDREMSSMEGGLYCATDADSKNLQGITQEGFYFTWTLQELGETLGNDLLEEFNNFYSVAELGNFEGRHILNTRSSVAKLSEKIESARKLLLEQRAKRPAPMRDEKILTAWNGLAISAFAKAGFALNERTFIEKAIKSANFLIKNLWIDDTLYRSLKNKRAQPQGYLDDYAFFISSLLDLYEGSGTLQWLKYAIELDEMLMKDFEDEDRGGFFMTSKHAEELIARDKPSYDGAEPSGNSYMALNLMRLYKLTQKDSYRIRAQKTIEAFSKILNQRPMILSQMLIALDFWNAQTKEIAIVTKSSDKKAAEPFLRELRKRLIPSCVVAIVSEKELETNAAVIPWLLGKSALDNEATAYVCMRGVCQLPTSDPEVFVKQLEN